MELYQITSIQDRIEPIKIIVRAESPARARKIVREATRRTSDMRVTIT